MNTITITAAARTYVLTRLKVPPPQELPWGSAPCDAFIVVLDVGWLTEKVMSEICLPLVKLPTEWVESLGKNSEYLHDLVDRASVDTGRQSQVGDGNPMTAWHDAMQDIHTMNDYLRLGGQGATDYRLVVVIGGEDELKALAEELERLLGVM